MAQFFATQQILKNRYHSKYVNNDHREIKNCSSLLKNFLINQRLLPLQFNFSIEPGSRNYNTPYQSPFLIFYAQVILIRKIS